MLSLWGLWKNKDAINKRKTEQLKRQANLDLKLASMSSKCPQKIIEYFLKAREHGRKQQLEYVNGDVFLNGEEITIKQMNENDVIIDNTLKTLDASGCQELVFSDSKK